MTQLTANSSDLYRVLNNTTLFAAKRDNSPVLECVRLVLTERWGQAPNGEPAHHGYTLTATANDRYTLGEDSCVVEDPHGGDDYPALVEPYLNADILVSAKELTLVAKALKTLKGSLVMVELSEDKIAFELPTTRAVLPLAEGSFPADNGRLYPDTDALWPTGEPDAQGSVVLNPQYYARFAKLVNHSNTGKMDTLKLQFYKGRKPVYVEDKSDYKSTFRGLIMPIDLKEG